MLPSVSTFFKIEKDPFYIRGANKKSREVVINLIGKLGMSDEQAVDIVDVPIEFVREVRSSLKK